MVSLRSALFNLSASVASWLLIRAWGSGVPAGWVMLRTELTPGTLPMERLSVLRLARSFALRMSCLEVTKM